MNLLMRRVIHYQGTLIGNRGIVDKVRDVFNEIYKFIQKNDFVLTESIVDNFSKYSFIKKIRIFNDTCYISYIDDNGFVKEFSFSPLFCGEHYRNKIYSFDDLISMNYSLSFARYYDGKYIYRSRCHDVTLKYLISNKHDSNINAITSLCVNDNNYLFYHSYIWNKYNNFIYDFALNIRMDKNLYDMLFLYKEINVLNYGDYCKYSECLCKNKKHYHSLYFFGLVTLYNEQVAKSNFYNSYMHINQLVKKIF